MSLSKKQQAALHVLSQGPMIHWYGFAWIGPGQDRSNYTSLHTLQALERRGLVKLESDGIREDKQYSLTDEGRKLLAR
jgi:hypothetical protein